MKEFIFASRQPLRALAVVLLSIISAFAEDTGSLHDLVEAEHHSKGFMGAVLVVKNGVVLLDRGYGYANLDEKIPNTPNTRFRIASTTKQFTAAAILLLEERGKLALTDPVSRHVPDTRAAWGKITLYHLLTHTSGIPCFTAFTEYRTWSTTALTPTELIKRFRDRPLLFSPGTKFSYSNSGYTLLGHIIERVSGENYATFMRKNVFEPLRLRDTGVETTNERVECQAEGYRLEGGGLDAGAFRRHDRPLCSRRHLFHDSRSSHLDREPSGRQAPLSEVAYQDGQTGKAGLCARDHCSHHQRPPPIRTQRRPPRFQLSASPLSDR